MKQQPDVGLGIKCIIVSVALGTLTIGCSSPRSVGIHIGDRDRPSYPVVHKRPGPPPHAPAHGYRKKFAYQYYPTSNVYYDRSRGVYFYLSGSQWEMAISLPTSIHIDIKEAVSLELDTDRPYVDNASHIKQVKYKGKGPKHNKHPWKK